MILKPGRLAAAGLLLALTAGALNGCGVIVVGGAAAGGAVVATDRRSMSTQMADKAIEMRASDRLNEALNRRGHVTLVSYYRKVLLTGEVATEEDRQLAQTAVAGTQDVIGVVNELAVMPESSLGQRSTDTLITSRVKANLINTAGVPGNSIKVLTERSTVYLMGRLTQREAELATEVARTTSGVERVVRVIDFISEQTAANPNDPPIGDATTVPVTPSNQPAPAGDGAVTQPVR